jgi:hypothetical protein
MQQDVRNEEREKLQFNAPLAKHLTFGKQQSHLPISTSGLLHHKLMPKVQHAKQLILQMNGLILGKKTPSGGQSPLSMKLALQADPQ